MGPGQVSPAARCRRRGNVMLFVIFVLGTLFASSIAFLTLMRADLEGVASRKSATQLEGVFAGLTDELMNNMAQGVMGNEFVNQAGPDFICGTADDVNVPVGRVPYAQIFEDCVGNPATGGVDGLADNPDVLPSHAMIAGVHPWISSIEPYDSGFTGIPSLDREYFAATDLDRALDDHADVHTGLFIGDIQPTNPASHPLRIRALDEGAPGPAGPFSYDFDATDDSASRHRALSDADGDGVVDSWLYRISLRGAGEADWGPEGYFPGDTDDIDCNGVIDPVPYTGAPSFTGGPMTPLPCDDFDGSGSLDSGTVYPPSLRRALAARLRDPDTDDDLLHDLYFSLRVIQNGGLVNLNASHRALVDNLFGLDEFGNPVAGQMMTLPYGPGTERSLRYRGVLAPFRPDDSLSLLGALGEDMSACASEVPCGTEGSLYRTLFGALTNAGGAAIGELQWTPVLDEPGISGTDDFFDLDWAGRWMNPNAWNDLNDSAVLGNNQINFDISHLLTTVSTDDLFMRNGKFGAGLLTSIPNQYNPAADGLIDATGSPYFSSTDSAVQMYPASDLDFDPVTGAGDRSFIDATTGLPKVPLSVMMDAVHGYGRPRDKGGTVADDVRYGHMQFCLHSIGNINNPTQREIQTVLDYFTIMLRNITNPAALPITTTLANAIADQAAQLTANLIDFADFDGGRAGGGAGNLGGPSDMPTSVVSRSGLTYYGIEKQPYISEVHWDHTTGQLAIELTNPHNVPIDLAPTSIDGFFAPYSLRLDDGTTLFPGSPFDSFSINFANLILPGDFVYVANDYSNLPGIGKSADTLDDPPDLSDRKIQLVRRFSDTSPDVVCDEVELEGCGAATSCQFQRDNDRGDYSQGWRVTVAGTEVSDLQQTLGSSNIAVDRTDVAPVHATTDDMGLESAFPTTGSMLLLMRYANTEIVPANAAMSGTPGLLDNGHMPVFVDPAAPGRGIAQGSTNGPQPMDGTTQLSIPWGQLVFDYFTALPFDNQFDPTVDPPLFAAPQEPGNGPDGGSVPGDDVDGDGVPWQFDFGHQGFVAYLRANQPTVDSGGVRVHGRININAAPWKVVDGVPLMPPQVMPIYKGLYAPAFPVPPLEDWKWSNVLADPNGGFPMGFDSFTPTGDGMTAGPVVEKLGQGKAKGIVAYRELREIRDATTGWTTGDYNVLNPVLSPTASPPVQRLRHDYPPSVPGPRKLYQVTQRHTAGFLTVGELANVRNSSATDGFSQMDNGQTQVFVGSGVQNYLFAVAPLVALSDWVTVKGHTFTAYGVLSGHGEVSAVRNEAERFEMVFDRSNVLISDDPAERPDVIYKLREPLSELNPN